MSGKSCNVKFGIAVSINPEPSPPLNQGPPPSYILHLTSKEE